jgi:UDP:flavonoid glycosyltransferase YjiC (YdhE family)
VKRTASPGAIAAAVRRVLAEPSFRAGASRLGQSIRHDAASGALVAELEDLPAAVPVSA